MAEYTYKDVIIDPEDPRVEIGAEYCFGDIPQNLVEAANSDNDFWIRLEKVSVSDGFHFKSAGGGWKSCIIRKKEPEKKYMPFDLSKEEVRESLWGKRIIVKDGDKLLSGEYIPMEIYALIIGFIHCPDGEPKDNWTIDIGTYSLTAEEALERIEVKD